MATETDLLHIKLIQDTDDFADEAFNAVIEDIDKKVVGIAHLQSPKHWSIWEKNKEYTKSDIVRITNTKSNQYYQCIEGGISGDIEPEINVTGSIIVDGTVKWDVKEIGGGESSSGISLWLGDTYYERGQCALYDYVLYRCNVDHTSESTFKDDITHWTEIKSDIRLWKSNIYYVKDQMVINDNIMYMCIQDHISTDFTDDIANWVIIGSSSNVLEFKANTQYREGQLVLNSGILYRAVSAHTSKKDFETDLDSWEAVNSNIKKWEGKKYYPIDTLILYDDLIYQAIANHTASNSFEDDRQANWKLISNVPVSLEDWKPNHYYYKNQCVYLNNKIYRCETSHMSLADFASDRNSWQVLNNTIKVMVFAGTLYEIPYPFDGVAQRLTVTIPDFIDTPSTFIVQKTSKDDYIGERKGWTPVGEDSYTIKTTDKYLDIPLTKNNQVKTDDVFRISSDALNLNKVTFNIIIKNDAESEGGSNDVIATPRLYRPDVPFYANGRISLASPNILKVNINNVEYTNTQQKTFDITIISTWDSKDLAVAANRAGKDFYIYACVPVTGTEPKFILSANSTVPVGYAEDNSRKVGGFHCLCADVGTIAGHPLSGYVAGDILPASVWDLSHRPKSEPEGMAYIEGIDLWVDIYLASWTGSYNNNPEDLKLVSKFGGVCADGASAEKFQCYKFDQIFGRQKKRLLRQQEFVCASIGSNQSTNVAGNADVNTTGGFRDTADRRMISNFGIEDCCGNLWQWGLDFGTCEYNNDNWINAFDANDKYVAGRSCTNPHRSLFGGSAYYGARCGSRASSWPNGALDLYWDIGARGASEPLHGEV